MSDDRLSPDEEQALRAMKTDHPPPPTIEQALVDSLVRDGLLVRKPARAGWRTWAAVAAGIAAACAAWIGLAKPLPPQVPAGPRFVLLLYAGDASTRSGPSRRQEYAAWARGLAEQGTTISGEELADDDSDRDGPRGFFIVSAPDAATARAIAATCPHVRYGGRIVVRQVV